MQGLRQKSTPWGTRPWMLAVAEGLIPGYSVVHRFARNSDIGATDEDIWEYGGNLVWPASAAVASVVSSDAADASAGVGGQTVRVTGLDASWNRSEEIVTLNGVTPVNTIGSYIRLNSMEVIAVGSNGVNVGNITASIGGNPQRYIEAGDGIDHGSHYTVPEGMTARIVDIQTWQGKDSPMDTAFWHRHYGESWSKHYHMLSYRIQTTINGQFTDGFGGRDDIYLSAIRDGAGANINCAVLYTLLLKEF